MYQFKNFIKKYAIFCGFFIVIGSQALHRPTSQQAMTPKLYATKLEAKTQQLKAQRTKQCYDLMLLMDTFEDETKMGQNRWVTYAFFSSLFQKNFPIMVSHNIVSNVCSEIIRSEALPQNLKKDNDSAASIKLNDENWLCYDHPSAKVMLFVPKSYIAQFSTSKNSDIQMKDCGFKTEHLIPIRDLDLAPEIMMAYIENKGSQKMPIIEAIESMFCIPNQPNSPTWNICARGHGMINSSIAGLKSNDFLKLLEFFQKIKCSYLHYVSCFAGGINQSLVKDQLSQLNVDFMVSANSVNEEITAEHIFYMKATQRLNPPIFIYNEQKDYTNFFAITESFFGNPTTFVQEKSHSEAWQKNPIALIVNTITQKTGAQDSYRFGEYGNLLDYNQPFVYIPAVGVFNAVKVDKTVKIITKSMAKAYSFENKAMDFTDSNIKTIIVYPNYIDVPLNISFSANIVSPKLQTNTYKHLESPAQLSKIFIRPPFSLNKDSIDPTMLKRVNDLIFLLPQALPENEIINNTSDVHIFENVNAYNNFSSLIPQFASFSAKLRPTIFAIKKLKCWNHENSNLESVDKHSLFIENMIIFTQLLPVVPNQFNRLIWQTVALFNCNQKTYALNGIFEKNILKPEESRSLLSKLFEKSPAQEIPNNIEYQKISWDLKKVIEKAPSNETLVSDTKNTTNLAGIISLLESGIDTTTRVEGQKSLQDVLLEKKANATQQLPKKAQQPWGDYLKDVFSSIIYGQE